MRTFFIVVALLLIPGFVSAATFPFPGKPGTYGGGGGGGQAYTDSFTRVDNTDLNENCTGGDTCEWIEYDASANTVVVIQSEAIDLSPSAKWKILTDVDAQSDTLSQYVAAQYTGTALTVHEGPILRADIGGTSSENFYVLRLNGSVDYELRACEAKFDCTTIASITYSNLGTMVLNDSLGIEVDIAVGNNVKFSLYHWTNQAPPSRPWSSGVVWTVCTSTCDQGFSATPTSTGRVADTGKSGGLYSGASAASTGAWDNWMFGDN